MTLDSFRISDLIPASPDRVYAAWLNGDEHGQMTGSSASCEPHVGGRFTAWDGYIEGTNLDLSPAERIVQAWRSSEFPEEATESRLEVLLTPEGDGTRVTIFHSEIPEGQGARLEQGWQEFYFDPMKTYFAGTNGKRASKPPVEPKAAAASAKPKRAAAASAKPKRVAAASAKPKRAAAKAKSKGAASTKKAASAKPKAKAGTKKLARAKAKPAKAKKTRSVGKAKAKSKPAGKARGRKSK